MSQLCTIKQNIIDTDPSVNDARNTSVYIFITYAARADFPRKYGNFPSAISSLIFGIDNIVDHLLPQWCGDGGSKENTFPYTYFRINLSILDGELLFKDNAACLN